MLLSICFYLKNWAEKEKKPSWEDGKIYSQDADGCDQVQAGPKVREECRLLLWKVEAQQVV